MQSKVIWCIDWLASVKVSKLIKRQWVILLRLSHILLHLITIAGTIAEWKLIYNEHIHLTRYAYDDTHEMDYCE